jgi:hypothetical protein
VFNQTTTATVPGPSWREANLPGAAWDLPDGTRVDYLTPEMIAEARAS